MRTDIKKAVVAFRSFTKTPIRPTYARLQASAAAWTRSSIFWVVMQCMLVVVTDVSGEPIGPIFKVQAVHDHNAGVCLGVRVVNNVGQVQYRLLEQQVKNCYIYCKTARPITGQGLKSYKTM